MGCLFEKPNHQDPATCVGVSGLGEGLFFMGPFPTAGTAGIPVLGCRVWGSGFGLKTDKRLSGLVKDFLDQMCINRAGP